MIALSSLARPDDAAAPMDPRPALTAERLRELRRLDWRFLLPHPRLTRVAFVGPASSALAEALRRHTRLEPLMTAELEAGTRHPGLLVIEGEGAAVARLAVRTLAPGGHLYWELPTRRHRRPWGAARLLRRLGMEDVRVYVAAPALDDCHRFVPLHEGGGLPMLVPRLRSVERFALSAVGPIRRTGALDWLLPGVCLVARKPE